MCPFGTLTNESFDTLTTAKKEQNARKYIEAITQMIRDNPTHSHRIAVFDVDRSLSCTWKTRVEYSVAILAQG